MALFTSLLRKHRDTLELVLFEGKYNNSSFISSFWYLFNNRMQRLWDEWHHGSSQGISHTESCPDNRCETRRMNQRVVRRWKKREKEREREQGESRSRKASLIEGERWETFNDHYQTGWEVKYSDAILLASLCLTLSNSLKELAVWAQGASSVWVPAFVPVITQCVLLQRLELHCISSNPFPVLFFPFIPPPHALSFPCTDET